MGSHNDTFPAEASDIPTSRPYTQPQYGNAQFLSATLNNAEQALAFAQAHIDQSKVALAQFRQMIGQ